MGGWKEWLRWPLPAEPEWTLLSIAFDLGLGSRQVQGLGNQAPPKMQTKINFEKRRQECPRTTRDLNKTRLRYV